MKRLFVVLAIVISGILVAIFLLNAPNKEVEVKVSLAQQISSKIQANKGQLIDVRTPEEFALEHAKDAANLPLADIEAGIYPQIAKDTAIYLYCRTGNRAGQAKTILEQAGFTNVTNIGGLVDWQTQGGEVIGS